MKQSILVGSDPELFVVDNSGAVSSAIGKVGGSKEFPFPVAFGALQEDNVLLEFNTTPASSVEEFRHHLRAVMEDAGRSIERFGLNILPKVSSHSYKQEELESFGPAAFVFGCDPDFNAWTNEANESPWSNDPGLRTAGGHIHIGYSHLEEPSREKNLKLIQMCDYVLGLPSVLLDETEGCSQRKELYGKAGAFRSKPYGCEYRTLSNFWLFSDELQGWAYEAACNVYENLGSLDVYCEKVPPQEVQRIINTNDKVAAKAACELLGIKHAV